MQPMTLTCRIANSVADMDTRSSFFGQLFQLYSKELGAASDRDEFVFVGPDRHLRYEEFSSFRAVIFLPWHLLWQPLAFMHFYAVAVPLLVPSGRLMYTLEANLHFFRQDATCTFQGGTGTASSWTSRRRCPHPSGTGRASCSRTSSSCSGGSSRR
ncbi:unnamed protein product [Prorocentrum cordatum]|uniref:Uncharacterized protein n=1 Tax=Prorocentrum cordatum TaxID=2364126 RepID=A0ABN9WAF5_9DINO|nr:unnamed protein product [Polarella glacialis]